MGGLSLPQVEAIIQRNGYFLSRRPVEFDHFLAVARSLGPLMGQYDGSVIGTVESRGGTGVYDAQSQVALDPHTEAVEFDGLPPRFLALWCENPGSRPAEGGATQLCSLDRFFRTLPANFQHELMSVRATYKSTAGLYARGLGRDPVEHPFVERATNGANIFRFSLKCMEYEQHPPLKRFVERYLDHFQGWHQTVHWTSGAFLIWNNHGFAHGRTEVKDPARTLKRVWIR